MQALQLFADPLYRKPNAKELKLLAPKSELIEKYAAFLRADGTGLTRLVLDKGCADNAQVVIASEQCLDLTMPGAGSSFSFRTRNYRLQRLADLTYTDRSFQSLGVGQLGIIVNLGDVALEQVSLATKGMQFLSAFVPPTDRDAVLAQEAEFTKGVASDGFLYRRGLYTVDGVTFALRSIAYDGRWQRALNGVRYNEFDFDKRRDIFVAFRVVGRDEDGSVTILWRIIAEQKAPELLKEKKDDVK